MQDFPDHIKKLALFRRFIEQVRLKWPDFLKRRQKRLIQVERNNGAAEKVAENILDDFFTIELDRKLENLNNQVNYTDMLLTQNGIGRLIIEVKRTGSLRWDRSSFERALGQARRHADQQHIKTIAISDGILFYAVDIENGGLTPRADLQLDNINFSPNSWWISVDGIYRTPEFLPEIA